MYSSWVFLMAGQLFEMRTSLDWPFLRDFMVLLKPNGNMACEHKTNLLTDLILSRLDDEGELVLGVFRSFVLLSHDASSYKQTRVQSILRSYYNIAQWQGVSHYLPLVKIKNNKLEAFIINMIFASLDRGKPFKMDQIVK